MSMSMKKFDFIIVGAGLYGAVFARAATDAGKKCLVVERRGHIGGNVYTENVEGIQVHRYGAHIFHTNSKKVWDHVRKYCDFSNFVHSPVANFHGMVYNMPFNMNTFSKLWGISTPEEARSIIEAQRGVSAHGPENLEQQAISLVGRDIYEKLVKGYTEKQWGRRCDQLPAFIIKRLPLRFTYDNNYFNDKYQGIPVGGYTGLIEKLLEGSELITGTDYLKNRVQLRELGHTLIYTGAVDEYFDYALGALEYRSIRFETEILDTENYQGCAVMNYTDAETPYTRVIEHRHFERCDSPVSVISREYSVEWQPGDEPYYPINDERNNALYEQYLRLAANEENVHFGGRLGEYRYYDMDKTVERALEKAEELINGQG